MSGLIEPSSRVLFHVKHSNPTISYHKMACAPIKSSEALDAADTQNAKSKHENQYDDAYRLTAHKR